MPDNRHALPQRPDNHVIVLFGVTGDLKLANLARNRAIGSATARSAGMTWPPSCSRTSGSVNRPASLRESDRGTIPSLRPDHVDGGDGERAREQVGVLRQEAGESAGHDGESEVEPARRPGAFP